MGIQVKKILLICRPLKRDQKQIFYTTYNFKLYVIVNLIKLVRFCQC
jgi:hypothetical protein